MAAALLGGVGALFLALSEQPSYRARTTLEIQAVNPRFLNDDLNPIPGDRSGADLPTEIAVLESESMTKRALAKALSQPQPIAQAAPNALWAWLQSTGLAPASKKVDWQYAISIAAAKVRVRPVGMTRVVEIATESVNAQAAAVFVNTLANEFIDDSIEARWKSSQRIAAWLGRQLVDLRSKVQQSETELQNYSRAAGLMFSGGNNTVAADKLRQLRDELLKAQALKRDQEARYQSVASARPEALLEVVEDPPLRNLQMKLSDLRQQMADLSAAFQPTHYRVQRLQAQINEVEAAIDRERSRIVNRFRNDFEFADRQEKLLTSVYAHQEKVVLGEEEKSIKYNLMKREVDTTRQLYDAMLQKMKEASVSQTMLASNVRVVDPAEPTAWSRNADPIRNALIGFLGGGVFSAGLIVLITALDSRFRSPGQSSVTLGLPELGVIPSASSDPSIPNGHGRRVSANGNGKPASLLGSNDAGPQSETPSHQLELVTWERKPSLLAESFRAVLTSVLVSGENGNGPRVLAVTSAMPLEGKSTVTSNLGLALAETNRRVLLVDADLRRPRLHSVYNVPNTWGLSDLLREKAAFQTCPLEGLVRRTNIPGLYVTPSGPEALSIASLLSPGRFAELLERFRREFDMIFIDTPPVMQMVDARLIGRLADAVILVVRAGRTSRSSAMTARKRLSDDGCHILGTVLNDWIPEAPFDSYYSSYYRYR
jgi:capsular exopolysaccharide synthesis family protein